MDHPQHFGGRADWVTEAEALRRLEAGEVIAPYVPEEPWFLVDAVLDVYTNNAAEIAPAWRLGNFRNDGLDAILHTFEQDATPGLAAAFHTPFLDLGRRWADRDNPHLYALSDIPYIWGRRHAESLGSGGPLDSRRRADTLPAASAVVSMLQTRTGPPT